MEEKKRREEKRREEKLILNSLQGDQHNTNGRIIAERTYGLSSIPLTHLAVLEEVEEEVE